MEEKMIMIAIILFAILCIVMSYCIGYVKGFKKMKKIDDEIIKELTNK